MATPTNNLFHIPEGPHHPGQNLLTEELATLTANEPVAQRPPLTFNVERVRQPEYAPEVKFLADLSKQQVEAQKKALAENRIKKASEKTSEKVWARLLGQPTRPLPTTLRQMMALESAHRVDDAFFGDERNRNTVTPAGFTRSFYHDTRAYYSQEELAMDTWPDPAPQGIEWVYTQVGPRLADNITLRYVVLPQQVSKSMGYYDDQGQWRVDWAPLHGSELDHFQSVALRHYQMVSEGIYGHPAYQFDESIREASEALLSQQIKTGHQAVNQSVVPESTTEKIRHHQEAQLAYVDNALTDIYAEKELEADTGQSMLEQAPIDFEFENFLAHVEHRTEEERAKHYIDGSKANSKDQVDLTA